MGLDVWFREDVVRILAAVYVARDGLTSDERTILAAICAGFGLTQTEVSAAARAAQAALLLAAEGGRGDEGLG